MRRFSAVWRRLGGASSSPTGAPYSSQEWDSAAGAAELLARVALRRPLSATEKRWGATAVHYCVGGMAAAVYAVAGNACSALRAESGAAFGFAFWLLGDELTMPRLGLTSRPSHYSLPMHLNSLGEHLVYGITAEQVRRALERRW